MLYVEERQHLLRVLDDLIKFRLIDCTGGLLALRCGPERLLMTTFGAAFRRWRLGLEDFIVTDNEGGVVEKHQHAGPASTLMVLEIFRLFPLCNAVLHTHAEYSLAIASLDRAVPPAAHLMQTLGEVPCLRADDKQIKDDYFRNPYPVKVPPAMNYRPEVAAVSQRILPQVKEKLGHRKDELAKHGLAFTTYKHGVTAFARNMDEAFNNLARVEASARTYIYGSPIQGRERWEVDERA
ncbi:MAG: class II aldolase/adducin family protein [Blastocatellales bacterium]